MAKDENHEKVFSKGLERQPPISSTDRRFESLFLEKESPVIETESLCMSCSLNGRTRILLWEIPFFKQVIIMSFECESCGFKNNEVQMARDLQEKAIKYTLKVSCPEEMDRMLVVNNKSKIFVPEIELEIPNAKQAIVTTVQGLFQGISLDLDQEVEYLKSINESWENLANYTRKLDQFIKCEKEIFPFHIILTDYTGNSFINQIGKTLHDNNLKIERFFRTKEQQELLGYCSESMKEDIKLTTSETNKEGIKMSNEEVHNIIRKMQGPSSNLSAHRLDYSKPLEDQESMNNVAEIDTDCYVCFKGGKFRTCQVEIPFFKEIIIMSFSCDHCGYKTTEVKTVGNISEKGKKLIFSLEQSDDLNRDLFKSDTATVYIPELEFEMTSGSLGSLYTTVEGLLEKIIENLQLENPFIGDSSDKEQTEKFNKFLEKLTQMKEGQIMPFKIIIDDPLDSCFLLNPYYPDPDPKLEIVEYERTHEQKEQLGLNDIKV